MFFFFTPDKAQQQLGNFSTWREKREKEREREREKGHAREKRMQQRGLEEGKKLSFLVISAKNDLTKKMLPTMLAERFGGLKLKKNDNSKKIILSSRINSFFLISENFFPFFF